MSGLIKEESYGEVIGEEGDISTLWIGSLPVDATHNDVLGTFGLYGRVTSVVISDRMARSGALSAFCRFATHSEASVAMSACSGQATIKGSAVTIAWAKSNSLGQTRPVAVVPRVMLPRREELTTLWIGNLPGPSDEGEIAALFSQYGQVLSVMVHPRPSPQGSHSGFVRFVTRKEAEAALAATGMCLVAIQGIPVAAQWARENSKLPPGVQLPQLLAQHNISINPGVAGAPGGIRTLFLGSLPPDATESDVAQAFDVASVGGMTVTMNRQQTPRGFSAFLKLESPEVAEQVLLMCKEQAPLVRGQPITVDWAKADSKDT
jgi:hypothetical protein